MPGTRGVTNQEQGIPVGACLQQAAYPLCMSRVPRSSLPDGFFHVYCRGVAASVAFPTGDDRTEFFRLLRVCGRRYRWALHAVCVLSTHYQFVLEARVEAL